MASARVFAVDRRQVRLGTAVGMRSTLDDDATGQDAGMAFRIFEKVLGRCVGLSGDRWPEMETRTSIQRRWDL